MAAHAYITPHAIQRFRERLSRHGTDEHIERAIRAALANPSSVKQKLRRDGTPAWTIRVRNLFVDDRVYSFRLTVVPGEKPDSPPVVVTVLPGTAGRSKGRGKQRSPEAQARHTHRRMAA